jgi:diaminohydroxyphosphoribosylaminopyrimidine deaminase / 5-amino-6-(5-phosphoribosylamino)uracil reductase
MTIDEQFMHRCLQLAVVGAGHVAPNPMVGAVLVHDGRIIGEGYHQQYGQAHAEVNCLASVQPNDQHLIAESTMYVSLEPCAHFGKTPPCADRLITEKVKHVVIACRDSYAEVDGKGMAKLQAAGIDVTLGVLEKEALQLNRRFFTYHQQQRPYIMLKWAQSTDGYIGETEKNIAISNAISNRMVHRWRSEEAAIMVGTNTAITDNPQLNNRYWPGPSPLRVVIDKQLRIPATHHLLKDDQPTLLFNCLLQKIHGNKEWIQLKDDAHFLTQLLQALHSRGIQSVLVEGGRQLLQSFIDAQLWDEARIITNTALLLGSGVAAPTLKNATHSEAPLPLQQDSIQVFYRHTTA